jgi:hypothetical protein
MIVRARILQVNRVLTKVTATSDGIEMAIVESLATEPVLGQQNE